MTLRGRPNADGKRHGSSGADSQRSTDTIRGPFASFSAGRSGAAPGQILAKRSQYVWRVFLGI